MRNLNLFKKICVELECFVISMISTFYESVYEVKLRKRLKNKDFSIICSNCIGGIIYHRLGLQFLSPTINLWINQKDFCKFVLNIRYYISLKLEFFDTSYNHPVAKLGDITIYFNHFKTEDEAKEVWIKRKIRINYENLFIIMYDKDGITYDDLKNLNQVKCKGKLVISNNYYPDLDYVVQIKADEGNPETRYRLDKNKLTAKRTFEQKFDYVSWLNNN